MDLPDATEGDNARTRIRIQDFLINPVLLTPRVQNHAIFSKKSFYFTTCALSPRWRPTLPPCPQTPSRFLSLACREGAPCTLVGVRSNKKPEMQSPISYDYSEEELMASIEREYCR
uniref:Uncharacterized protein n=1 Tax=Chrysemys picta bellii TaxID=8478 RepID=A0A8C3P6J8_CHRPI